MSQRSTRKIIAGLLEDDFEDEGDFKEIYGNPTYRTFNLEFDFGAGEEGYSTVVNVPAHLLEPAGDDSDKIERIVRDYAYKHLTDEKDPLMVGFISHDDWDWLVTVEETDPQPFMGEAEDWETEEDYKDVWGDPPDLPKGSKFGYFVYFSRPIVFATPFGPKPLSKIGPYPNTYEATRKKRFGLMDEEGVTALIRRERIVDLRWGAMFEPPILPVGEGLDDDEAEDLKDVHSPLYYSVYDNFVDKSYSFPDPKLALAVARMKQEGRGVFGVVDEEGNVVLSSER